MQFVSEKLFNKDLRRSKKPFKSSKKARNALSNVAWNETVLERARHLLSDLMEERPVEVYAVALGLLRDYRQTLPGTIAKGLEDMARSAARNSLRDPLPSTAEMNINPDDHARLTRYNRRCRLRLVGSLATGDLIKRTGAEWIRRDAKCEVCPSVSGEPSAALGITEHPETWRARYWKGITASIGEFPCEESFGNDQIWNSTLQILEKECPRCYKTAEEEYPRFKQKAIQVITEIIDEIELEIVL